MAGAGTGWTLKSLPSQVILWFHEMPLNSPWRRSSSSLKGRALPFSSCRAGIPLARGFLPEHLDHWKKELRAKHWQSGLKPLGLERMHSKWWTQRVGQIYVSDIIHLLICSPHSLKNLRGESCSQVLLTGASLLPWWPFLLQVLPGVWRQKGSLELPCSAEPLWGF